MTTKDQRNLAAKRKQQAQFQCKLCIAFKRALMGHEIATPQGTVEPEIMTVDPGIKWDVAPHLGEVVGICRGCSQLLGAWSNYQANMAAQQGKLSKIIIPRPGEQLRA